MPYLVKSEALIRAKERAANAGIEAEPFMNEFLDLSARKDVLDQIHYAVFLTAAIWLEQSPQYQTLLEAENGVRFTQMKEAIASLRSLQAAYDAAFMLIIPPGMEPIVPNKSICAFNTQTLKTVAVF